MATILERLARMSVERRQYTLNNICEHLFQGGPSCHADLCQLGTSREWFDAQRRADSTYGSLFNDLQWVSQACEADPSRLATFCVVALLQATLRSLRSNLPAAAIGLLTRCGAPNAKQYAEQQTDAGLRCESLCRVASSEQSLGQNGEAIESLKEASAAAGLVTDPLRRIESRCCVATTAAGIAGSQECGRQIKQAFRDVKLVPTTRQRTHAAAIVAQAADRVGALQVRDRAVRILTEVYRQAEWPAAAATREFGVLGKSTYMQALANWDRTARPFLDDGRVRGIIIKIAATSGDRQIIDAIVDSVAKDPHAYRQLLLVEPVVEAMAEVGMYEQAVHFISLYANRNSDEVLLREALARGGGRRGDLTVIERALVPIEFAGKLSLSQRVWTQGRRMTRALIRNATRLVGLGDLQRWSILCAGLETLLERYPSRAKLAWKRVLGEPGWLSRRFLRPHLGRKAGLKQGRESLYVRWAVAARYSVRRWSPLSEDDLFLVAESFIQSGRLEAVLQLAGEIPSVKERSDLFVQLAHASLFRGDISVAVSLARRIPDSAERVKCFEKAVTAIAELPPAEADRLLTEVVLSSTSAPVESLGTNSALRELIREYAKHTSCKAALDLVAGLSVNAAETAVPELGRAALDDEDMRAASDVLALATNAKDRTTKVWLLSGLAGDWASSRESRAWRKLAKKAYSRSRRACRSLPEYELVEIISIVAKAARALKQRSTLKQLLKQLSRIHKQRYTYGNETEIELALVDVAAGFVATGEYLRSKNRSLKTINLLSNRHWKALAFAAMSEAVPRLSIGRLLAARPELVLELIGDFIEKFFDQASGEKRRKSFWQSWADELLEFESRAHLDRGLDQLKQSKVRGVVDSKVSSLGKFELVMPPPSQITGNRTQESTAAALKELIRITARAGLLDDLDAIVADCPKCDLPTVVSVAVAEATRAGRWQQATAWLDLLDGDRDRALPHALLAETLAEHDPSLARSYLDRSISAVWVTDRPHVALRAIARAAAKMSGAAPLCLLTTLLTQAVHRGRGMTLTTLGALAPVLSSMLDSVEVHKTVEQILETECWWTSAADEPSSDPFT